MMGPLDAWAVRRLLTGKAVNGEMQGVSPPLRPVTDHLADLPVEARPIAWDGYLCGRSDRNDLTVTLAETDPDAPPPEADKCTRCANLADLRLVAAETLWLWPSWIAAAVLNALAAEPGTGKTILAMWLAWTLWTRSLFPDGQPNNLPAGTRTLWVPGDRHFGQLLDVAGKFGLPDEALLLNASPDDPTGGLDLDDSAELTALHARVEAERPGLVIVDTVGMTTGVNLCRPEDARQYFGPLLDMAIATATPFLLLTHLNKDGQALGRRINGACRVVLKMTHPDPDGQPDRRRLWVEKTLAEKPPALGMTISTAGCSFDFNPPAAPEPGKGGRPPDQRAKAEEFIRQALAEENDRPGNDLKAEWEKGGGAKQTFWRAAEALEEAGEIVMEGGPGTRKQKTLHLIGSDGEDNQPS